MCLVNQIKQETASNEISVNTTNVNEPIGNLISAAVIAFARVKIRKKLQKLAHMLVRRRLKTGHGALWASEFLNICEEVDKRDRNGHVRILDGIRMTANPSQENRSSISHMLSEDLERSIESSVDDATLPSGSD